MAADRQIGLGTVTKVDHDSNASFTTIELTMMLTPPPRNREQVDMTVLADTLETFSPGIEQKSEYVFTQLWDPTDTNHTMIDTLFGDKTTVNWQIVTPHSAAITMQFAGWVAGLQPAQIEKNGNYSRQVTIVRTGAITTS